MENKNITTKIIVCSYEELNDEEKKLVDAAKEASNRSYAPYSRFQVGAAVRLAGGVLVSGSNQENAAYPSGTCAERTTLFYANSQYPDRAVEALAIAAQTGGKFIEHPTAPCGACRQVILETEERYRHPIRIYLYGTNEVYIVDSIVGLLPLCFGKSDLPE
ncbi:cytidine deaminase [Barnesiella viscericola]|uniref:Cytidine deaminase n=1 Tax=Barnesiella viscericola TaxID=397865 RepID=A0A921STY5_9BACT|nr:cytidine deaminase [Barnesiella viscericola]HJG88043.1 cytidine deaminase [Barnesiella viscericola]